jgi:hypothetical protein
MTNPRSGGGLSETCKTYLEEWIKEQPEFYNRTHEFKSKYLDKGNECEQDSLEFAARVYGWGLVSKNTDRKENEYIEGECDLELADIIADIKNSWSDKTFPLFDDEVPTKGYDMQLQGYCELWNKSTGSLIYTLMDAPEHLVEKEARSRSWEMGLDEVPAELYEEVKASMTYSNLPDKLRIKRFNIFRDRKFIESVNQRVIECRKWIDAKVDDFNSELLFKELSSAK